MKSSLWFVLPLCLLGTHIASSAGPATSPTDQAPTFQFKPVTENSLGLWEGTRPVFVYNHGVIPNTRTPGRPGHSTYFHPIYGLDGEMLTDDFPKDHEYHRGLYWAWPHIKVAGKEYDLWSLQGIRSEFRRWLTRETSAGKAVLAVENAWSASNRDLMIEKIRIEVHPATDQGRIMDLELTWMPVGEPVSLSGAPGKSYGGLTFRFGPRTEPIITVPTGRTTNDLLMAKLPWADFCGDFGKDKNIISGVAILVHPKHTDFPPTWMTRHYGVLAVGWPGVNPQTFPVEKSFSCRYRLWIHQKVPGSGEIQKVYDAYRSEVGGSK